MNNDRRKSILWVTGDWFMAHDIVLVPIVSSIADIHWVIIFPEVNQRFKESEFDIIKDKHPNIEITFLYIKKRLRNPNNVRFFYQIIKIQKAVDPDLVHLDFGVDVPWALPVFIKIPKDKTIVVLHQGEPHEAMKHRWLSKFIRWVIFHRIKNVKMFSKSQAEIFKRKFHHNKLFVFRLPLLDFGKPQNIRPNHGDIRFLSFGTLNYSKNIDLLIDAACLLYERGARGFKISINGFCENWDEYQNHIKYPQIFELNIRLIDNSEIPNLFNGSHYLVQPYRVVSQSGPTKIAFQYNLPILATNLPGFTDEIEEGINGYIFEKGNVEDLADKMQMLIEKHKTIYPKLLESEKAYTEENYSIEMLVKQYVDMFNEVAGL